MGKKKMKVVWISGGVSSFVAGYLAKDVDKFIYIDVADQHQDTTRYVDDCEKILQREIERLTSTEYACVEDCVLTFGGFRNAFNGFAPCTNWLKKRVRKNWEYEHKDYDLTYVWGFDCSEARRAENLLNAMPEFNHEFPLIDKCLSKQDVHAMSEDLGLKRPKMYDLGYNNNNCIGCVKGGMGYWNKIRVDFPEVFARRAALEREVGHSIIKGVFLDELEPTAGRMSEEIVPECDIMCHLAWEN